MTKQQYDIVDLILAVEEGKIDSKLYWLGKLEQLRMDYNLDLEIDTIMALCLYQWFEYFDAGEDKEKMVKKYNTLIEEEKSELYQAWYKQDFKELIDAYIDLLWVRTGKIYWESKKSNLAAIMIVQKLVWEIANFRFQTRIPFDLFYRALIEVAYSNWTKDRNLKREDGKILKGSDYKAPDWEFVFTKLGIKKNDDR